MLKLNDGIHLRPLGTRNHAFTIRPYLWSKISRNSSVAVAHFKRRIGEVSATWDQNWDRVPLGAQVDMDSDLEIRLVSYW